MKEDFLYRKLKERDEQEATRNLVNTNDLIDFCSNDYLGVVKKGLLDSAFLRPNARSYKHGSTGSRLLAGNSTGIVNMEKQIAQFHESEASLIYNSGYTANIGLLSCIPQRGDTILYDALSHASIRDGVRLSFAHSYSFAHNDTADLTKKIKVAQGNVFVVTETVFSMDGDCCPLLEIVQICEQYGAHLIIDEAHALGVIGSLGQGLAQSEGLHLRCFARMYTFGKALGCHGAVICGSQLTCQFLINFSKAFIYTTALPEISIAAIKAAYEIFPSLVDQRAHLGVLMAHFQQAELSLKRLRSMTPIQPLIAPGNRHSRDIARRLAEANVDVRPILYPTVPRGTERLRIVLHSFNTIDELKLLVTCLRS